VAYVPDLFTSVTALTLSNVSTLTVSGTLTNAAGVTLSLTDSTLSGAPFANHGTLLAQGTSVLNGTMTTAAGSLLRVAADVGGAALTVLNGFTNSGAIELTNISQNWSSTLAVTNGTLVNAAGASLSALPGAGSGNRILTGNLDNRGTLTVAQTLTVTLTTT